MPRGETQVRVVDGGLVGYDAGEYAVNVWMVQDVPADACSPDGLRRPISSPSEFVDYLRRVPGLEVGPPGYRHVDGILATDLRLVAAEVRPCFQVAYLIDPMSGTTASLTNDREARLTILEVDGRIVAFEAASRRGLDAWLPEIDAFLASIDFLPPY